MIDIAALGDGYALNLRLIQQFTHGLTHEQSLVTPEFESNCLNWVLGHMAVNRGRVLDLLDYPRVLGDEEKGIYEPGSAPILTDGPGVIPMPKLIDLLDKAGAVMGSAFESVSTEKWNEIIPVGDKEMTVVRRTFGFYFHETFHTGQVEVLAACSRER